MQHMKQNETKCIKGMIEVFQDCLGECFCRTVWFGFLCRSTFTCRQLSFYEYA